MSTGPGPACVEVVESGLQAAVQDAGRPGLGSMGIPRGGAADPLALLVANALLGNAPGAAAVELLFAGARLRALRPVTVAVAGADLGAGVVERGERVAPGTTAALGAGETLAFEGVAEPRPPGCRAVVGLPGGVDVPLVLGSRSTALGAGFGGLAGRALRAGDRLAAGSMALDRPPAAWIGPVTDPSGPLRILPGPHAAPGSADALASRAWTVGAASDRVGLRLQGQALPAEAVTLASHGVVVGAVQLPPDGQPIVLVVDHQATGGYPVIAVVASADRARLGQLAPGDAVTFEVVGEPAARRLAAAHRATVDAALEHLRDAAAWDALWRGAGG